MDKRGPRDLCVIHALPMWWSPSEGTWACQEPVCTITEPCYASETIDFSRLSDGMDALRFAMNTMRFTPIVVTNPFNIRYAGQ